MTQIKKDLVSWLKQWFYTESETDTLLNGKQNTLVSGTNIKTINNQSILGNGNIDTSPQNVFYGTCSTTSTTQTKVVTVSNWSFTTGNILFVKFDDYNKYNGTAKISIGGVEKDIATVGTTKTSRYYWKAGEVVGFVYDGTNMVMLEQGTATTTYYGITKLSSSVSSTSEVLSATPNAVKQAYDLANGKQDALVSGTNIKTINNESLLGSGNISISGGGGTIDDTVTQNSSNPVKSSGIYSALQSKQDDLHNVDLAYDMNDNCIFFDDGTSFYLLNDNLYLSIEDNALYYINTNGDEISFDDIVLDGDSRLSDARTPTSHSHSKEDIDFQTTASSFNIHLYETTSYMTDKNNFTFPQNTNMIFVFNDMLTYMGDYVSFKITRTNGYGYLYDTTYQQAPYNINTDVTVKIEKTSSTTYTITFDTTTYQSTSPQIKFGNAGTTDFSGYFSSKSYSRKATWLDMIYPIGSVYISTQNRNPSLYFGGEWEQIEDRFLLASGTTYSNGSTGGEATHTLTVDEMPSHNHTAGGGNVLGMGTTSSDTTSGFTSGNLWNGTKKKNTSIDSKGGGQAHNNMPPYIAVMVYERIA